MKFEDDKLLFETFYKILFLKGGGFRMDPSES